MQLRASLPTIVAIWGVTGLLLGWAYLSDRWRRLVSLGTSLLGLVFLIAAINTEGLHEAPTVTEVLGQPYLLPVTTASASLPFYLMTAACLMLGLTGLALGERAVETLRQRCVWSAIGLAAALALLRFGLERAATPLPLVRLVGVNWLAPVVGVLLFLNLEHGARGQLRTFVRGLAGYTLGSRAAVLALYVVCTTQGLGTHYDVSPLPHLHLALLDHTLYFERGSLEQFATVVLMPQTLWALYTLVAGSLAALLTRALLALGIRRSRRPDVRIEARSQPGREPEAAPTTGS